MLLFINQVSDRNISYQSAKSNLVTKVKGRQGGREGTLSPDSTFAKGSPTASTAAACCTVHPKPPSAAPTPVDSDRKDGASIFPPGRGAGMRRRRERERESPREWTEWREKGKPFPVEGKDDAATSFEAPPPNNGEGECELCWGRLGAHVREIDFGWDLHSSLG